MLRKAFRLRILVPIALGACVLAGFAGCGGGSEEASGPLTKAQFVQQAGQICTRRNEEKGKAVGAAAKSGELLAGSRAQAESFVRKAVLVPYSRIIDEIGGLKPPPRDRATVALILKSWRAGLKEAEAAPTMAITGDPFIKGTKAAKAYGLKTCVL